MHYCGVACVPGWFVSVCVSISCNACGRCWVSPWCGTGIGWCQLVSVVSWSWRCVFASCAWRVREKMKEREADPVCLMCALLWCCLCSWMVCVRVCVSISCDACGRCWVSPWCGTRIGWCQGVSVMSWSWMCVCASCAWRERR